MMKIKSIAFIAAVAALTGCGQKAKSPVSSELDKYAVVRIARPDLSGISDNGKEVLNLYKFAAIEADKIFWEQSFGDKAVLDSIEDKDIREYAMVNYGPWDRRNGKPFVEGYDMMPAGMNFYPMDMTAEEFAAFADSTKNSPYTMIRRNEDGSLESVWYHDAFASHIDTIANCLSTAAELTIKPSVKNYLLKKIEALRTDNYYESELAWLDMDDSKMDLVLGPDETSDDRLYGIKKSYGAYVLLKNLAKTEELKKYTSKLDELQASLPCKDEYKTFVPGSGSNIFACTALYYAGAANCDIKVIALNLPFDERVQAEKGTRTILLENIINEKFNHVISPVGALLINKDQSGYVDANAFFWNTAFREVAHGLGVKETVNGLGTVSDALGSEASLIEEVKADVLGVYFCCNLAEENELSALMTKKDALTTYLVGLIRSARFGNAGKIGRANIICYNYLMEKGAFNRNPSGVYTVDYEKAALAVDELSEKILTIQATGDVAAAKALDEKYSVIGENLEGDFINLRLENIPIDLRFEYDF